MSNKFMMQSALQFLLLAHFLTACGPSKPPEQAADYAFTGVTLVRPELNTIERNQTVIVRGERIVGVGPASDMTVPAGTTLIDGDGLYLMPGLAEMHAHVPTEYRGRQYLQDMLFLWVANGVTTMRGMLADPYHLELREELAQNRILGPRLYTAGPSLNGSSVKSVDQARTKVREQVAAGYDFIKMHPRLSREEFDAIAETAESENIQLVGHVSEQVGLWRALEAGQDCIEHLDSYMAALVPDGVEIAGLGPGPGAVPLAEMIAVERIALAVDATVKAGTWNSPTETAGENMILPGDLEALAARPEMRYMPPRTVRGWLTAKRGFMNAPSYDPELARLFIAYRRQLIKALQDAGAGLLLGSDAPQILNVPGFSIHRELGLLVESGLTPAEALTTGTANAARFLDQESEFGFIREGLAADLVLLRANPLEDVDNAREPAGVMLRGRWLSRAELDQGLEQIAVRYAP